MDGQHMANTSFIRARLTLASCLLAAGCSTTSPVQKLYEGPERPGAEVASVVVPYTISIKDINGAELPTSITLRSSKEQRLVLLPGAYLFGLRFSSPYEFGTDRPGVSTPRLERKAVLEAGHTYQFMSRVTGDASSPDVEVWIEDNGTKTHVDEIPAMPVPKPMKIEPAAAPKEQSAAPAAPAEEAKQPQDSSVDELKRSWQSATPDERAEFLKSIVAP